MGLLSQKRVLVVDSQDAVRIAVTQLLRESGFDAAEIRSASGVPAALEDLNRQPVDLLITGLELEPVPGLDLLRKIRCSDTAARHDLVVMALSNGTDLNVIKQALELHADGLVVKPVRLAQLESRLIEALTRPRAKQEPAYYRPAEEVLAARAPQALQSEV